MNSPTEPDSQDLPRPSRNLHRSIVFLSLVVMISFFGYLKPSVFYYRTTHLGRDEDKRAAFANAHALLVTVDRVQYCHGSVEVITNQPGAIDPPQFIWQRMAWQHGPLKAPYGVPIELKTQGLLGFGFLYGNGDVRHAQSRSKMGSVAALNISVPTWFLGILAAFPGAWHFYSRRKSIRPQQFPQSQPQPSLRSAA